ncbi:MAG TPA: diacylglycerol kinase family protein [Actinomycetota bacterium]|nr:diacylglycerol kinase family protein [Actinomycetota bacterium]
MIAGERPRAALIINPASGRIVAGARDQVVAELDEVFDLSISSTTARNAGIDLARAAVEEHFPLVVAFGGDGLVNEVVNGIAGTAAHLGIIPGGTMNVFARALGIPTRPHEAVRHLAGRHLSEPRMIPLGRIVAGDEARYFTFSAGCGFDAETAWRVESHLDAKRRWGELFFYWSAARVLVGSYRHRAPTMVLEGPFGRVPVAMAIACNCGPYAYLLGRPVNVAPKARLTAGIDAFALRSMRFEALPLYAWRSIVSGNLIDHDDAFYASDLDSFELTSEAPFARHVDGEPLEPASAVRFEVERDSLMVVA